MCATPCSDKGLNNRVFIIISSKYIIIAFLELLMVDVRTWSGVFLSAVYAELSTGEMQLCKYFRLLVNTEYYAGKGWRGGLKICPLVSQLETGRQVPYRQALVQTLLQK
jgi:hypothetical protein